MAELQILKPSLDLLSGYADACRRGWSRDNIGREKTAQADLERIATEPEAFVASLDDPEGKAGDIVLPDGTTVRRLPGYFRFLWDGAFCGTIGFRWQPGTSELPAHVLGHVGYAVVPWKRGLGYATRALGLLLPDCRAVGLDYIELTTDDENIPSQKVILSNGGECLGAFHKPEAYGGGRSLRYRIAL